MGERRRLAGMQVVSVEVGSDGQFAQANDDFDELSVLKGILDSLGDLEKSVERRGLSEATASDATGQSDAGVAKDKAATTERKITVNVNPIADHDESGNRKQRDKSYSEKIGVHTMVVTLSPTDTCATVKEEIKARLKARTTIRAGAEVPMDWSYDTDVFFNGMVFGQGKSKLQFTEFKNG